MNVSRAMQQAIDLRQAMVLSQQGATTVVMGPASGNPGSLGPAKVAAGDTCVVVDDATSESQQLGCLSKSDFGRSGVMFGEKAPGQPFRGVMVFPSDVENATVNGVYVPVDGGVVSLRPSAGVEKVEIVGKRPMGDVRLTIPLG